MTIDTAPVNETISKNGHWASEKTDEKIIRDKNGNETGKIMKFGDTYYIYDKNGKLTHTIN